MVESKMRTGKTDKSKSQQCPYCIEVRCGQQALARHIVSKHKDKIEEWIKGK